MALDIASIRNAPAWPDNPLKIRLHQTAWNDRTHIEWQEHRSWKTSWL
jgi:hypothetical protein